MAACLHAPGTLMRDVKCAVDELQPAGRMAVPLRAMEENLLDHLNSSSHALISSRRV
jgi:hypothetical protein